VSIRDDAVLTRSLGLRGNPCVDFLKEGFIYARVCPAQGGFADDIVATIWARRTRDGSGRWFPVDREGKTDRVYLLAPDFPLFPLLDIAMELGLEFPALDPPDLESVTTLKDPRP
jgi:hypothetical protein